MVVHELVIGDKTVTDAWFQAIQDMNNLKRMLQQAESDYYALFRLVSVNQMPLHHDRGKCLARGQFCFEMT